MGMREPGFFRQKNIPSNEGFDLSMMFSFNKALSNIRINKIFRKIKEDYFTINETKSSKISTRFLDRDNQNQHEKCCFFFSS